MSAMGNSEASVTPVTLTWPIDTHAMSKTLKVTAATAAIGVTAGASIGFGSRANPYLYGGRMGTRFGLICLVFMGTREYLISPALLHWQPTDGHVRRLAMLSEKALGKLPEESVVVRDLPGNRILDSALAGSLTAAGASLFIRQNVPIRAAFTGALVFSALQLTGNSLRMFRLYLLRNLADPVSAPALSAAPADSAASAGPAASAASAALADPAAPAGQADSADPVQPAPNRSRELIAPPKQVDEYGRDLSTGHGSVSARLMNLMSYVSPLMPMTDDQYLAKLERRQEKIQLRLRGIEQEEEWLYRKSQENQSRKS